MKKFLALFFMAALFSIGTIKSQLGLEDVIVETYYVADANDIAFSGVDPLPAGAVTYRIYVDMAAGWELQAIFGATNVGTGEVDSLVIRSTSPFWNHTDFGALYGYSIQASRLDDNTVGLDSYFTTGRSSGSTGGTSGVMEGEDTNGGAPVHPHTPVNLLVNNAPAAGLALTVEDGNIPFTSSITWTATPGLETILDPIFNNVNDPATEVVVSDGALGVTVSLVGPTASNKVLVGQFTTAGVFSGKLNLQLRRISDNLVEQWVAETPQAGQFTSPALTWGPNAAPTVAITAPTEAQNFTAPTTVNFDATATDADGNIASVQFYLNGVAFGAPIPGPGPTFSTTWPTGIGSSSNQLIAVATDNDGATKADTVNFTVTGNPAPVVVLTSPSTAVVGQTVNISATATDADGIASVQFFFNNAPIGAPIPGPGPYATSFVATPAGTYTGVNAVRATAIDNAGVSASDSENLTVSPNQAPTVTIDAPADGSFVSEGVVVISATATDLDGTVTEVEFFANGVSIGVDNSGPGPWTINWNAVYATYAPSGDVQLTAKAKDNLNLVGPASPITDVTIINPAGSPYILDDVQQFCNDATVCMPVTVISDIENVIGFDMILEWDNNEVYPTGNIIKSSDILNPNHFETDYSIDFVNEKMLISVFLDVDAPLGTFFDTTGVIVCVEFAKRPAFSAVDSTIIDVTFFQESYFDQVVDQTVPSGEFSTTRNTVMTDSHIEFWLDNRAIGNDGANPQVKIQPNTSIDCSLPSAGTAAVLALPIVLPDINGAFTYDLADGVKFSIDKDLAGTTDVQSVVNGFDALLVRRILIDDISYTPSVYAAISADVNRDGVISAGDVSQINQRAVLALTEFRQAWNYNVNGTPNGNGPSKDWQFIDQSTVLFNPSYQISSTFPQDNGVGYSKARVPQIPFCLEGPVTSFATCPVISDETYVGIMYGDVNGNWRLTSDVNLRSPYSVDVNMQNAHYTDEYVDVPVSFTAAEDIYAIDLKLDFNMDKLAFNSVLANGIQVVGHFSADDNKLRVTSNSLSVLQEGATAFVIRFDRLTSDAVNAADLNGEAGYLNGDQVKINLNGSGENTANADEVVFNVFPNPTNDVVFINVSADVTAEIMDMNGRVVYSDLQIKANENQRVDVSRLAGGLYTVRVYSDVYTSAQRLFISK